MTRSRLINTTKEKTFEPGGNWINKIFPPPSSLLSMTMTVEIAFLDSNVVKARVGRAMKIEKNFNCPPPPPFFRGLATSKLFPNSFNLDGTKRLVSRLFFFYFHSTLERAVSTIFSFEISHLAFDRILLFVLFSSFFLISSPFLSQKAHFPRNDGFVFWIKYASRTRSVLSASLLEERTSLSSRTGLSPVRLLTAISTALCTRV